MSFAPWYAILDFTNKVVLVTGGTKGIGCGIAECFLKAGATVLVCGRNSPLTLPGAEGRSAEFFSADVRENADLNRLFTHIQERYGRLDVLVKNADGTPYSLAASGSHPFSRVVDKPEPDRTVAYCIAGE